MELVSFSSQADIATVAQNYLVGCSSGMTAKINFISNSLGICSVCPQKIEEPEEQVEDVVCDWKSCVKPIIVYLRAVHNEDKCR